MEKLDFAADKGTFLCLILFLLNPTPLVSLSPSLYHTLFLALTLLFLSSLADRAKDFLTNFLDDNGEPKYLNLLVSSFAY